MKKSKKKLIFIKLGGSLITKDKPYTVDLISLRQIAKEIHLVKRKMRFKLLIGNGGGSFPHISASKFRTTEGFINKKSKRGQTMVQDDASRLNRIVVAELIKAGLNAISVQPSATLVTKDGKIKSFNLNPIKGYLRNDLVPVVFGDVVVDLDKGCSIVSTEKIFSYMVKRLKPDKIIMITNVEGVYDSKGNVIPLINRHNFKKVRVFLKQAEKVDVTGGMLHKVKTALQMAKGGLEVDIIGSKRGNLKKCLEGKKIGTVIRNF